MTMTIKGQINLEIRDEKYSLRELKSVLKNEGRISSMLPSLNIGSASDINIVVVDAFSL